MNWHRLTTKLRLLAYRSRRRRIRWGNIARLAPFSLRYGRDRGTVIDRSMIDEFFSEFSGEVTGRILEIRDAGFANSFGHGVSSVEVVDIDPTNTNATLLVDLQDADPLPLRTFDCVIAPQTLQYMDDPRAVLQKLYEAVAPGGSLLVTVPGLAQVDHHLSDIDKWRFLRSGFERMVRSVGSSADEIELREYGGISETVGFLIGASVEELSSTARRRHVERYPLVLGVRVRRQ